MGNLIFQKLKKENLFLRKKSFVYGNIKPDLTLSLLNRPHYKENCIDFLKEEISRLSESNIGLSVNIGTNYSERLGVICHYITDFFCFAHNPSFDKSILAHIKYEKGLSKYMKSRKLLLNNIDSIMKYTVFNSNQELFCEIENMHMEYLNSFQSKGIDILYSYHLSMCVILTIASLSMQAQKNTEVINYENCLLY